MNRYPLDEAMTSEDILDSDPIVSKETASSWLKQHGASFEEFLADNTTWTDSGAAVFEYLGY